MKNDARALSIPGQTSLDISPIAQQIVPYLDTFQNRLRSPRSWRVYQQDNFW